MNGFVRQCFEAIHDSTPHLYICLTLIKVGSSLWSAWQRRYSCSQVLREPIHSNSRLSLVFPLYTDTFSMSPDGKRIACGSRDGFVRVMDLASGRMLRQTQPKVLRDGDQESIMDDKRANANILDPTSLPIPIDAIAYAPDGTTISAVCGRHIVHLDSETLTSRQVRDTLPGHFENVWCMAISPDAAYMAFGCESGNIAILDAKTCSVSRGIEAHSNTVNAIAFSPDSSRLASVSEDRTLRLWDVHSGDLLDKPSVGAAAQLCAVTFSSDGKGLLCGDWNGSVRSWNAESGGSIEAAWWRIRGQPVLFLAYSPDGETIIAIFADGRGRYFRPSETVNLPPSSEARCHYRGIDSYGDREYRWVTQARVRVRDACTLDDEQYSGHTDWVMSVAISPDGKRVVSGSNDCTIRVWDVETGAPVIMSQMRHLGSVRFVTFSPDRKHIASGGGDKVIRIWDAETGEPVQTLEWHSGCDWVSCGAYSSDGSKIVSGSGDGMLRLWDTSTGRPLNERMTGHTGEVNSTVFSPDSSCIASASDDCTVRLWDGRTGRPIGEPLTERLYPISSVAFSPDGSLLASGAWDRKVHLWDLQTRCSTRDPFEGHEFVVASIVFSPDSNHLFSAGWDGTIRCWDISSGKLVGSPLVGHTRDMRSLAISLDGKCIVSGSEDNSIRVWNYGDFYMDIDHSFVSCGVRTADRLPVHIPRDGWIRAPKGELLLWVPQAYRGAVCDVSRLCIAREDGRSIRIVWEKICHGTNWTAIRDA